MRTWIRRYYLELAVFGAIFGVLLLCCAPDLTWINTDSDGVHYVYSAKYLYPAHKTSAPLFLLLGHTFLWLPFGTEFWRISFMSVLATTASAGFVYLIIKESLYRKLAKGQEEEYTFLNKEKFLKSYKEYKTIKLYALIGALVFGSSALVISQSIMVETYALVTMFGIGAYYFAIKEKWLLCALMLGAGGATHLLIGIPLLILLVTYKGLRQWKYIGVMSAFLLFYLYIPITTAVNNPPDMWGNTTGQAFLGDNLSTAIMLGGGLSIWELPKRILDALGILGASFGLALIPIGYFLIKRQWYKEPLFWLFAMPVVGYITNLAPQTYVYMMPAIAFGAVIAGIGLAGMKPYWKYAVLSCAIVMLIFNANYFDIGRTLDPELSARKYYDQEMSKVPDENIILTEHGWTMTYLYNKEENRNIVPISIGTLGSVQYQTRLESQGIKLIDNPKDNISVRATNIALSIVKLNDNVWTTKSTTPRTYGIELMPARGNEDILATTPSAMTVTDGSMDMIWYWQPSNPYDIITGAIEIEEWIWIVFSNYCVKTFVMLGTIGAIPCWIGYTLLIKKKKWNLKKHKAIECQ